MSSPVDSLTEDIDLLLASIGLLSSISDGGKKSARNAAVYVPSPKKTPVSISTAAHDKDPPCDVPRGIGEESCPPSPSHAPITLRLDLPKRYSDQSDITSSEDSSHSDGEEGGRTLSDAGTGVRSLSTPSYYDSRSPSPSLGREDGPPPTSPSISFSTIAIPEGDEIPVVGYLHIEKHMMSARSSQVLPPSPNDLPSRASPSPPQHHKHLPSPPGTPSNRGAVQPSSNQIPKSEFVPHREGDDSTPSLSSSSSRRREVSPSNDDITTSPRTPQPTKHTAAGEFPKLHERNPALYGTHSRTQSAPVNEIRQIPSSLLAGVGHSRTRSGLTTPSGFGPATITEHTRSMIDLFPLPPRSPPPVPPTPIPAQGLEVSSLSRQPSTARPLPSQLRYQLSQGSLRRPPPNRLPPLNTLDDKPRPQTEFLVDDVHVHQPSSMSPSKDPRFGALPYTSPPGKTQFSIYPLPSSATRSALVEQEKHHHHQIDAVSPSRFFEESGPAPLHVQQPKPLHPQSQPQPQLHPNTHLLPSPYNYHLNQFHRGRSSPSVVSEMDMPLRDENGGDGDGDAEDDDDARSYMSNPLDGMISPISPDETIFLEGRPRPRRNRSRMVDDEMAQPKSFFDLGFDMEIGRLEKRSRWKFWPRIRKHHK